MRQRLDHRDNISFPYLGHPCYSLCVYFIYLFASGLLLLFYYCCFPVLLSDYDFGLLWWSHQFHFQVTFQLVCYHSLCISLIKLLKRGYVWLWLYVNKGRNGEGGQRQGSSRWSHGEPQHVTREGLQLELTVNICTKITFSINFQHNF